MSLFLSERLFINYYNCSVVCHSRKRSASGILLKERFRTSRNDREILHQSGFTLLEVLVAMTILSVVLAVIYSTFFLSHKAIEGMDESLIKLQEARRALDILRCELDAAFFKAEDEHSLLQIKDRDFYGKQASKLTFTAFSTLRPGLSRVSYYIEENDGRLHLLKKIESHHVEEETEGVDIIEDVGAFTIEAKYNNQWVRTWDTDVNKHIPDEIRISLGFRIKDRTVTLSDISRPRIGKTI